MRVIFRLDANQHVGIGHMVRSLALADIIRSEYEIVIATVSPSLLIIEQIKNVCQNIIVLESAGQFEQHLTGNEIVVCDGYEFNFDVQKKIKDKGCKLIMIDDLHEGRFCADAIINNNPVVDKANYSTEPYTNLYIGFQYLILRKGFYLKPDQRLPRDNSFIICMGGSDLENISLQILQHLSVLTQVSFNYIHVIVGAEYNELDNLKLHIRKMAMADKVILHFNLDETNLIKLMDSCHYGIFPASGILREALARELLCITGYYIKNQELFNSFIIKEKLAISAGNLLDITPKILQEKIIDLNEQSEIIRQSTNSVIDGRQQSRLKDIFKKVGSTQA